MNDWRDAGVVERACLESMCTCKGTQGSNPCLSAFIRFAYTMNPLLFSLIRFKKSDLKQNK